MWPLHQGPRAIRRREVAAELIIPEFVDLGPQPIDDDVALLVGQLVCPMDRENAAPLDVVEIDGRQHPGRLCGPATRLLKRFDRVALRRRRWRPCARFPQIPRLQMFLPLHWWYGFVWYVVRSLGH